MIPHDEPAVSCTSVAAKEARMRRSGHPRMLRIALALLIVSAVSVIWRSGVAGAVPVPFQNCGSPSDVVLVTQLDASIWPPQRGHQLTLTTHLVVNQAIPGGTESLQVTLPSGRTISFTRPLGVPARSVFGNPVGPAFQTASFVILLTSFSTVPIPAGPISNTSTFTVPSSLAAGTYHWHFNASSSAGPRIACLNFTVLVT